MRKLNTGDILATARAVKQSGLRAELQRMVLALSHDSDAEQVGVDTILKIFELFGDPDASEAVMEMLAGPFEMTAQQVLELDLDTLMDGLDYIRTDGGLTTFFKRLSGILGSKSMT